MKSRMLAMLLAVTVLLALAGCAASSDTAAADSADTSSNGSAFEESATEESTTASGGIATDSAETAPPEPGSAEADGSAAQSAAELTEKLIYSADLTVETTDFDAATGAVEDLVAEVGGFLESSNVSGDTRYDADGTIRLVNRYADYVIRVPADQFINAMNRTGEIGNVVQSGIQVDNVTSQFIDQEARQASLEVEEERLLELAAQAPDVETLIALETRLSEVRYEIESIERNLRNLQNQVDYSTIRLSLYEVAVYTPTAPVQRTFAQRLGDAFRGGWSSFVDGAENFAVWFVSALPSLVLVAVLVVAVVLVIRQVRRRNRREKDVPPDDPPKEG